MGALALNQPTRAWHPLLLQEVSVRRTQFALKVLAAIKHADDRNQVDSDFKSNYRPALVVGDSKAGANVIALV